MILLQQSIPSVLVFCDAFALNIFRILKFLVLSLTIKNFPYLFKKTFIDSLLCLNSKRTSYVSLIQ